MRPGVRSGAGGCPNAPSQVSSRPVSPNQDADAHDREQAYCETRNLSWDDALSIFLHHQKLPVVTTTRVVGVTMLPNEQFDTVYTRPA